MGGGWARFVGGCAPGPNRTATGIRREMCKKVGEGKERVCQKVGVANESDSRMVVSRTPRGSLHFAMRRWCSIGLLYITLSTDSELFGCRLINSVIADCAC